MPFQLPELPYAFDALEPMIDAQTMEIHHTKHHAAYTNNLNDWLENTPYLNVAIEQLLVDLDALSPSYKDIVRNQWGGFYNHNLFWQMMCPGGSQPSSAFVAEISSHFGSLDACMQEMSTLATKRFGSGRVWLVRDGKKMTLMSTANQDAPISQGYGALLGIDVREHAYYLKYQNRRAEYITNWWKVVNRARVEQQFQRFQTTKNLLA